MALLVAAALASTAIAQDKKAPATPAATPAPAPAKAAAPAPAAAAGHKMWTAKDLEWKDLPSIPGAKIAILEGPMNVEGPFTVRIKGKGLKIPPHTHPGVEHVTVLAGEFSMGMGEKWDDKAMHTLKVGDVMIMQPNTPHFAGSKGETTLQLHGMGPWKVVYVNPADDPANKAAAAKKDEPKKDEPKKDEKKK
jgi:anti-sigma factor ChrR (cupin superfamily)